LMSSKGDIAGLWDLPDTQRLIRSRKFHMSEAASLCADFNIHSCCQIADLFGLSFLHDLDRISNPDWQPTNYDILYARLKSTRLGTALFEIPPGTQTTKYNRMTDVSSADTRRHAWLPYFEDSDTIIFVTPISAFDQYMCEKPWKNCIEHSLSLFKDVVSDPILHR